MVGRLFQKSGLVSRPCRLTFEFTHLWKRVGCNEGLSRRHIHEALHCALPPALRYLNLAELARGQASEDCAPEGSRGNVAGHLSNLPRPRMVVENVSGKCQPVAAPSVLLEDEELLHPVPVGLSNHRRRDEREPGIATFDQSNVSKEALCEYLFFEVVAVLAPGIQILIPDVRQLVLIELQH